MSHFTVVYDACVLYPAPLRDFLIEMASADMYRAKWTDQIHDEWTRSVLENRPDLKPEQLERTRQLMNANIPDCLVQGYEELIPSVKLPDPDDRHVLAAAIFCGADVIVTFNLKDFPKDSTEKYGIDALHPDDFIMCQIDLAPHVVCAAAKRCRERLKNPPKDTGQYLATLEAQQLTQSVTVLRRYSELI